MAITRASEAIRAWLDTGRRSDGNPPDAEHTERDLEARVRSLGVPVTQSQIHRYAKGMEPKACRAAALTVAIGIDPRWWWLEPRKKRST